MRELLFQDELDQMVMDQRLIEKKIRRDIQEQMEQQLKQQEDEISDNR